ncbi:hypothetical protein N8K70_10965 [Microbacterium betulae]|uniref:Peptidase n=1 Tax=Microbacterium betulae TaxID=2981139 RepID=A0AA97FG84_9MICO|nr:hypothetical protein [Microbacterium sp. AB]WOF21904.1 hypothetical protein N8K70_10965 [Microbacterium sp. AB]
MRSAFSTIRMRAILLIAISLGSVAWGATTASAATGDDDSVGIRLVPDGDQSDARSRAYLVGDVPPGDQIRRTVQIDNPSATDKHVFVYASAAEISDGAFTVDGVDGPDISSWITAGETEIDLEPGVSAEVPITVSVPTDAPEGEYYAAIWAELRSADTEDSVTLANRVGVRVYLTVGEGNGPAPDFEIGALAFEFGADGLPAIVAQVTNTGTTAVDLGGQATLETPSGGVSAGPFSADNLTLGPGQSGAVRTTTDSALSAGEWNVTLSLTSGMTTREATANLTLTSPKTADAPDPAETIPPWIPWAAAAVVVALLILLIWAIAARSRRRSRS